MPRTDLTTVHAALLAVAEALQCVTEFVRAKPSIRAATIIGTAPCEFDAVKRMAARGQNFLIHPNTTPHDVTVFAAISVPRALTFTEEEYSGMS